MGVFRTVSTVGTLSTQKAVEGLLASSSDINGSVLDDTVVQKNCSLHIRGNLLGNLTIESGAKVVVEGSVGGKIVNKGAGLLLTTKHMRLVLRPMGLRKRKLAVFSRSI